MRDRARRAVRARTAVAHCNVVEARAGGDRPGANLDKVLAWMLALVECSAQLLRNCFDLIKIGSSMFTIQL